MFPDICTERRDGEVMENERTSTRGADIFFFGLRREACTHGDIGPDEKLEVESGGITRHVWFDDSMCDSGTESSMSVTRRIYVSLPADYWLPKDMNDLKWAIVDEIENLGYTPEVFTNPKGKPGSRVLEGLGSA